MSVKMPWSQRVAIPTNTMPSTSPNTGSLQGSAKLSVNQKFQLTATELGRDPDPMLSITLDWGMIWNGALYLLAWSYIRPENGLDRPRDWQRMLLRLTPDGMCETLELDDALLRMLSHSSIMPTPKGWLLLPRDTHHSTLDPINICYLPATEAGFGPLRAVEIAQDLPLFRKDPQELPFYRGLAQETGRVLHGGPTTEGYIVAVPFHTQLIHKVVFLKLDSDFRTGTWLPWLSRPTPSFTDRLKGLFGAAEAPALGFDDLLSLDKADFTNFKGFDGPVRPEQVSSNGDRLFVFSRGSKSGIKYGTAGTYLAEVGADGRADRRIFYEDHRSSSQNHARRGFFTDGGRSFVMQSEFASTDPWKGAWASVDLASGDVTLLPPPRGCKNMSPLDIDGRTGWFFRREKDGSYTIWMMAW